jgi:hypothetical protein
VAAFAGLPLFGLLGYLIDATYQDLWHFGTDRPPLAGLMIFLCVLTGLVYLMLGIALWSRFGWSRWLVIGLVPPAVACGLYAIVLGGSHTYRLNPPSPATVMFFGGLAIGFAIAMIPAARHDEIQYWLASRDAHAGEQRRS